MHVSRHTPGHLLTLAFLAAFSCVLTCLGLVARAQGKAPYAEREVSFSGGKYKISGSLRLPSSFRGKLPVVLFVASARPGEFGAGALRKLAQGLARAGIASFQYQAQDDSLHTNSGELDLLADRAVAALEGLATLPEIDPSSEFVLGHSVGGTISPYIAKKYPGVRGVILAGAVLAPVDEGILSEQRTLLAESGKSEQGIQESLNAQAKILADVRSGKIPSARMINGEPASFWRDWMSRDPLGELAKTKVPVLILQGEQDTANEADSERLQKQIEAMGPRAQLRLVPGLQRFFTSRESAQSTDTEPLTEIISRWVLKTLSSN